MAKKARIVSTDAVTMLSRALFKLDEHVRRTLDDVDTQVRRAGLWFEQDRHFYWKAELRRSFDRISEARVVLEQARSKKVGDHEPTCYVERKALSAAKQRGEETQRKAKELRGAITGLRRAISEYQGAMVRLRSWFDADHPKALAALDRMAEALDAYTGAGKSPREFASGPEMAALVGAMAASQGDTSTDDASEEAESPESNKNEWSWESE